MLFLGLMIFVETNSAAFLLVPGTFTYTSVGCMHIPLRESPFPSDIEPNRDESNEGQSFALPVLTTSVNCAFPLSENALAFKGMKAKVKQSEMIKASRERILIIKLAVKFCEKK